MDRWTKDTQWQLLTLNFVAQASFKNFLFKGRDTNQCPFVPPPPTKRDPKGHISCTWVQCATFVDGSDKAAILFFFPMGPENTNLVEDVEIWLLVKFLWILLSIFRGECENVSVDRKPGGHLGFPIGQKHKRGEGDEILLPVKFIWIPFSGFREEVENFANQRTGQPSRFSDRPETHRDTNLVEDFEVLLPVEFRWILFSGVRGEDENVLAGAVILVFRSARKHKLGRGHWDLALYQVSLNSIQWFQRKSWKCFSKSEAWLAMLFFFQSARKTQTWQKTLRSCYMSSFVEFNQCSSLSRVDWLLNVTINDISVIYVKAHRYAGGLNKKLDLRSGSQRHYRHFVGFFNVTCPSKHRHGTTLFTVIPRNRSISVAFYDAHRCQRRSRKCLSQSEAGRPSCFSDRFQKHKTRRKNIEILLPNNIRWIPFSRFNREVENFSANQRPGRPSCFSDRPEKHKLGRRRWDLASCQVWLNSVQRFQKGRRNMTS